MGWARMVVPQPDVLITEMDWVWSIIRSMFWDKIREGVGVFLGESYFRAVFLVWSRFEEICLRVRFSEILKRLLGVDLRVFFWDASCLAKSEMIYLMESLEIVPWKLNTASVSEVGSLNSPESLSGIETSLRNLMVCLPKSKFPWIPIRDWNFTNV